MFLIFFLVTVLILTITLKKQSLTTARCTGKHKWVVKLDEDNKTSYLICKECGKLPGED